VRLQAANLQFRLEGFNVLNRTNFALPNANIFAAAPNGSAVVSPAAGRITSALASRQVQVAMKVTF